jgi:hypothetical protein
MRIRNESRKKVDFLKLAKTFSEPAPIPKVEKLSNITGWQKCSLQKINQ